MAQKSNPLRDKSYAFALRIIFAHQHLIKKKEYVLSKQLLKSGTSIGSNIKEGLQGQSRKDFIAKFSISLKEAHETEYWICLLRDSHFFTLKEASSLLQDVQELIRLLTAIIKTSKSS